QSIINNYKGELPLSYFLKNYFRQHPKLGSRDRKQLSTMAFSWYRCSKGVALKNSSRFEDIMTVCMALCGNHPDRANASPILPDYEFNADSLFPFDCSFTEGISKNEWIKSMLTQPDLFIRVRKNRDIIIKMLTDKNIATAEVADNCLSLPNGANADAILPP